MFLLLALLYVFDMPTQYYKYVFEISVILQGCASGYIYMRKLDFRTDDFQKWEKYRKNQLIVIILSIVVAIFLLISIFK